MEQEMGARPTWRRRGMLAAAFAGVAVAAAGSAAAWVAGRPKATTAGPQLPLTTAKILRQTLVDQRTFPGRLAYGAERQVEVEPRRHRDHDRVHARVGNRLQVVAVAGGAPVAPAIVGRPVTVAAGVARHQVAAERPQVPAVHARDEAASQKRDAQRLGHFIESY